MRSPRLILAGALLLAGCAVAPPLPATRPPNLGQLKMQLLTYVDSGGYERDLAAVSEAATAYIDARASTVAKPAMVLDIDETALSNLAMLEADDFGYIPDGPCDALPRGPCGATAYDRRAATPAIAPVLALYRAARAKGVAVFFLTGRKESERPVTALNLGRAGYTGWTGLILRPVGGAGTVAAFKSAERAGIEAQGYTILVNLGDQRSDLVGGHAERPTLLPDPFYFIP